MVSISRVGERDQHRLRRIPKMLLGLGLLLQDGAQNFDKRRRYRDRER